MKVVILYHPNSEHDRRVTDYVRDYKMSRGEANFNLLSLETREGSDMARLYDIVSYPAVLALTNDGQLQKVWQEEMLPLMSEVEFYLSQQG